MSKVKTVLVAGLLGACLTGKAQQHNTSKDYQWPKDSLVTRKLHQWQNVKFGLLMHWGTYSEWGVVESWSICPEDEGWCERKGPYAESYNTYLAAYEKLQTTFNPVLFNPQKWAKAARQAGMKYVVFTTKHHDGFCMFDTDQTDYKVTDPKTPFSSNPRSNIAKEVFSAFRADSFMIGAYFSKPDWHSNDYWWRYFPPQTRNPSYNPAKHPDKWNQFKQYTYNQIEELMTDYGKMDILWLDGGWVRPKNTIDTAVDWQRAIPYDQDIDMPNIARMARKNQPGLLVVDRTVSGEFENYVTPEQSVPAGYLPYPWESCMTLGDSWSYIPKEHFKSTNKVVHILTDVVSRNGNLLLNVAPGPDGDWHTEAYERLQEIGSWMTVNGEAIYNTQGDSLIGEQGHVVFTHKPGATYAIYRSEEGKGSLPATVTLTHIPYQQVKNVSMLGAKQKLTWKQEGQTLVITIPEALLKKLPCKEAWSFKIRY
ncbi:alpha-L-fucosidase [Filimonas lacunae]|uniref:alpha-L-fucosidase n=1 Tax=Filimonas lacunae TaxID=477680 RepID=A0A173MMW2_9BACT|nr:alpha-L-fucosidase [Filimonas lacunae]BAV08790.1 alpha-L-fucosidase [Filimonas lacunae]SIS61764.1 alpha-L-fucosidase [Filimonas lacunae]